MPVKAKNIKDLPLKNEFDGSESLLVQDSNGTKQVPLGTIVDEIKQNSQEKITEIESELAQTNEQLSAGAFVDLISLARGCKSIKVGDKYLTNGYYETGDGGAGTYYVVDDDSLQVDSIFVYQLQNGLKLKLIHSDEVCAETLGFKASNLKNGLVDNTPTLLKLRNYQQKYGSKNVTIKFGHGWYGFSSGAHLYSVRKQGFSIQGASIFSELFRGNQTSTYEEHSCGTVFFALEENQEYILKLGNLNASSTRSTNELMNLSNITFWGGTVKIENDKFTTIRHANGCRVMLDLEYVVFSKMNNLTFTGGTAVEYCVNWCGYEFFGDMWMFRDVGKLGVFKSAIKTYADTNEGTHAYAIPSGSIFSRLSFENIAGTWIELSSSADVQFTNISGETTHMFGNPNATTTVDTFQTGDNHIDIPLITFNDVYGGVTFSNITVQHLSRTVWEDDSKSYSFRTLFKCVNPYGYSTGVNVSNVSLQGSLNNVYGLTYTVKNIDGLEHITYQTPVINFKNYHNAGYDLLFKVPYGVRLNKDKNVANMVVNDSVTHNIFNKVLDSSNTRLPSRIRYESFLDRHILEPLNTHYSSSVPEDLLTKAPEPNKAYSLKCYNVVNDLQTLVSLNLYKSGSDTIRVNVAFVYTDNSIVQKTLSKSSTDVETISVIVPLKSGAIKEVYVEQSGEIRESSSRLKLIDLLIVPFSKSLNLETTQLCFNSDGYGGIVGASLEKDGEDLNNLITTTGDKGLKPFFAFGSKTNNIPTLNGKPHFFGISMSGTNSGSQENPVGFQFGVESTSNNQFFVRKAKTDGFGEWGRLVHEGWFPTSTIEYRPKNPVIGYMFFDQSLRIPIWWNGSNWIKADGTIVE